MDIELAILFADVVDSTKLYERLGDLPARDKVRACIDVMRDAIELNRGTLIKTMGDGVMASFPAAGDAANAAAQMQEHIVSHTGLKVDGRPMAIRVGFHIGRVMLTDRDRDRDANGSTVNVAARVTSEAKGGQIVATEAAMRRLSYEWRTACHPVGEPVQLKGVHHPVALYELLWKKDVDVTIAGPMPMLQGGPFLQGRVLQLRLWMKDREFIINEDTPSVQIGRDEHNDCVVIGEGISRWHAQIEIRNNKLEGFSFMLTDKSRNGTFVHVAGGEEDYVWRESRPLKGEGMIGLGKRADGDSPQTIRFVCEERCRVDSVRA